MFKSCSRIVCIEPVRLGWGRFGNCASHVTQRKCDGVLFSGNCSEGIVSSFPCGFIKEILTAMRVMVVSIGSRGSHIPAMTPRRLRRGVIAGM